MDDFDLLTRYVEDGCEDAFGDLVRRHIGMVYSSALRQMGDPHDAEDVAQAVFISLARQARKLRREQLLAGWLMTATRYLASHARRTASRRRTHERRAAELANTMSDSIDSSLWPTIAPELDDAMAELSPRSRDAVLLRYFQNKSVRETAESLGISEEAAKRRLSRALEQLRALFARRGTSLTCASLGALLAGNSVHAAPPWLAQAATAASMKFAASATIQKGMGSLMSLIKTKAAAGLLLLSVGGTTGVVVHHAMAQNAAPAFALADAAPAREAGKDASWRKRFNELYRLDDNQILRRVPPPFIPERAAYFNSIDPGGNMLDANDDGMTVFEWGGTEAELNRWSRGTPTVSTVLNSVIGLPSYQIEMKLKDGLRPMPGDWIVRKDESREKQMEALAKILRDELKWPVHFEKRDAEHDVILVSGTFTAPKINPDGMVDVFIDSKPNQGGSGGDLPAFIRTLGELSATEPIDETENKPNGCFWRVHTGSNLTPAQTDKMLANVSAQTGLKFKRAKRVTTHWVVAADAPAGK